MQVRLKQGCQIVLSIIAKSKFGGNFKQLFVNVGQALI